ncbi:MAG: hypothetical protein LBU67_05300 [Oscillospiraceae bacterium]|nr:hypothetical protein [Oscillospiraceae bacterium]
MPQAPAVCPLCAHVHTLDAGNLPDTLRCACGAMLTPRRNGAAVLLLAADAGDPGPEQPGHTQGSPSAHMRAATAGSKAEAGIARAPENPQVAELLRRADAEQSPAKRYALYQQALALDGDSLAANLALLHHGRLHEGIRHPNDYGIFKAYLFHIYEQPGDYTPQARQDKAREFFDHPLLQKALSLSADADATLDAYLHRLAREYVQLFLRGRNAISHHIFGFSRGEQDVARTCASIVAAMLDRIAQDDCLTPDERTRLAAALRAVFCAEFSAGDAALQNAGAPDVPPRHWWQRL